MLYRGGRSALATARHAEPVLQPPLGSCRRSRLTRDGRQTRPDGSSYANPAQKIYKPGAAWRAGAKGPSSRLHCRGVKGRPAHLIRQHVLLVGRG